MAIVDKHTPGSFGWVELATTDQNAAKTFYTSLFGWGANESPMGPGLPYIIFQLKGRDVAAGFTQPQGERDQGVTPHWNLYVTTDNADLTAATAGQAGGKILRAPVDVPDAGRMAVIEDPSGATFNLWQGKDVAGLGIVGEPNAFCWADLGTPDPARAGKFYTAIFGWKIEKGQNDPSGYLHIKNGEHFIGGIPPAHTKTPPHWLVYFMVADVAAAAAKAGQLGAKTLMPVQDMPGVGTWAILADPQGAVFAIFKSAR